MILGPISYLDCIIFVLLLIPQLLINVPFFPLIRLGLSFVPFLVLQLPYTFIRDRQFTWRRNQPPFVQQASPFQDFVIRCVRFAFARMPASIGRVFFSKEVALPFFRWRLLRHGLLGSPVDWYEVNEPGQPPLRGLWIDRKSNIKPDIIVYYCHGGGFSMGSAYFYLEPLIALLTLLKERYTNPAIFALEYTLVPDANYPTQLQEAIAGYQHCLEQVAGDTSRICVSGDSAGGTLVLSLMLGLAQLKDRWKYTPGYAALLSPWVSLHSPNNRDTVSDYLNASTLELYGSQFAGDENNITHPLASPGCCTDMRWWRDAMPKNGIYISYGSEEVLGPEIRRLAKLLRSGDVPVAVREEPGGVHAWVIARLFLEKNMVQRGKGMQDMVSCMVDNIPP